MPELAAGEKAPDFTLPSGDGGLYSLKQFRGKKVILYFYPADDTETCRAQACTFRDNRSIFDRAGAAVIGISPDPAASHKKFTEKYSLNFLLLSDEKHLVMKKYGVWKRKLMFGKKYMGVVRSTFVIDEKGIVMEAFRNIRLKGHLDHIQEALTQ